eukprot:1712043-Rhodomonas_salina.1
MAGKRRGLTETGRGSVRQGTQPRVMGRAVATSALQAGYASDITTRNRQRVPWHMPRGRTY